MSYRLTRQRPISDGLRDIVKDELRTAVASLDTAAPDEKVIFEVRKSVKKTRAILRLLQHPLGSSYVTENRRLRDAAHRLAPMRDADATLETLRMLQGRYPSVITAKIARDVARGLEVRRRQVKAGATLLLAPALGQLRRAESSVPDCVKKAGRFAAVRTGLTRGYVRAQKRMAAVGLDSDATAFHAWRRRVKDHTYQVRLFTSLHPSPRGRARSLKRLETWLGDDHNMALLRATILDAPDAFGDARTTALVLGCIVKAQASLRQQAIKLGHRLFGAKPAQFRDAVAGWWDSPDKES